LEQLNEIDTTDVDPLTHPVSGHTTIPQDKKALKADDGLMMSNVKHKLINNAIKIKSMLGG